MSLRFFHLFFIALSIVLAAFVAAWAQAQYGAAHRAIFAVTGVVALLFGAAMAGYGATFFRKTRNL